MKRSRTVIFAAVFAALTAVKIFCPEQTAALRAQARSAVERDMDYTQTVSAMGRRLLEGGAGEELIAALGFGGAEEERVYAGNTDDEPAEKQSAGEPETVSIAAAAEGEEAAAETVVEEGAKGDMPDAVSAFIESQEKFTDCTLPENVRVDMPELPFEYAAPVSGDRSSGFGFREHPIQGELKFHYGTDFAAEEGDNVTAFADGYVYAAAVSDGYGNYLIITHDGGFSTIYAHLSEFSVKEGDMVSCGQIIGKVGQTGSATGPHLHFEMLQNDVYINPEYYI